MSAEQLEQLRIDQDDVPAPLREDGTSEDVDDSAASAEDERWFIDEDETLRLAEKDLSEEDIARNRTRAAELKEEGNESFRSKQFETACDLYTKALRICPLDEVELRSVLRCNRAAGLAKLEKNAIAIEDCTRALALNDRYEKALLRRAQLYELNEDSLEKALEDYQALIKLNPDARQALASSQIVAQRIQDRNERMKTEMLAKLKDLGNMILKPFGLSTNSFKLEPQEGGGYSVKLETKQ